MAGKTKDMSQIKQLLLLHQQGKGIKAIARTLGMSKNTLKRYLQKLSDLGSDTSEGLTVEGLVQLDNPLLEAKLHAGNPAYKQEEARYAELQERMPYLVNELEQKGVTRKLLWEEYKQACPNGYGYTQFCFHLQQQRIAANPSMALDHKPGDKLYIDFAGQKLHYIDRNTGETKACEVFVACLPYSGYSFAFAVNLDIMRIVPQHRQ